MRTLVSRGAAAVLFALAAGTAAFAQPALAASTAPFTPAALAAAQRAGKPVLVSVHAGWCPVCARQESVLKDIAADPANKDLLILRLDFDKQKAEQRALGVQKQSTLIAYRGARETGRSMGETDAGRIGALVATTRG